MAGGPLRIVDERAEADYADSFDYYYVPCYYVGGEKVHEGHAERPTWRPSSGAALEENAQIGV